MSSTPHGGGHAPAAPATPPPPPPPPPVVEPAADHHDHDEATPAPGLPVKSMMEGIGITIMLFVIGTWSLNAAILAALAAMMIAAFSTRNTRQTSSFAAAVVVGLMVQVALSWLDPKTTTESWSVGPFKWTGLAGSMAGTLAGYIWYNGGTRLHRVGMAYFAFFAMLVGLVVKAKWPTFALEGVLPLVVLGGVAVAAPSGTPVRWVIHLLGAALIGVAMLITAYSTAVIYSTPKAGAVATPSQDSVAIALAGLQRLQTGSFNRVGTLTGSALEESSEPLIASHDVIVLVGISLDTESLESHRETFIAQGVLPRRVKGVLTDAGTTTTLHKGEPFRVTSQLVYDLNSEGLIAVASKHAPLYDEIFFIRLEDLKAIRTAHVVPSSKVVVVEEQHVPTAKSNPETVVLYEALPLPPPPTPSSAVTATTLEVSTEWVDSGIVVMPGDRMDWGPFNTHREVESLRYRIGKPSRLDDPEMRTPGTSGTDGEGVLGLSTACVNTRRATMWVKSVAGRMQVPLTLYPQAIDAMSMANICK